MTSARSACASCASLGHPEEFASLAVHALTDTYLNGETIRLDGAQRFQPR